MLCRAERVLGPPQKLRSLDGVVRGGRGADADPDEDIALTRPDWRRLDDFGNARRRELRLMGGARRERDDKTVRRVMNQAIAAAQDGLEASRDLAQDGVRIFVADLLVAVSVFVDSHDEKRDGALGARGVRHVAPDLIEKVQAIAGARPKPDVAILGGAVEANHAVSESGLPARVGVPASRILDSRRLTVAEAQAVAGPVGHPCALPDESREASRQPSTSAALRPHEIASVAISQS